VWQDKRTHRLRGTRNHMDQGWSTDDNVGRRRSELCERAAGVPDDPLDTTIVDTPLDRAIS
jgi:hypothetical protein